MAEPVPARPSCPDCGAPATGQPRACAACGCPFVEDAPRVGRRLRPSAARAAADGTERQRVTTLAAHGGTERQRVTTLAAHGGTERRRFATLALVAGAFAAAVAAALMVTLGGADAGDAGQDPPDVAEEGRRGPEVLARSPLSTPAAERRLEERFGSAGDDDTASVRCSALQPRPAHAIRWCRIRYAHGGGRTVIVLSNPKGYELLVER